MPRFTGASSWGFSLGHHGSASKTTATATATATTNVKRNGNFIPYRSEFPAGRGVSVLPRCRGARGTSKTGQGFPSPFPKGRGCADRATALSERASGAFYAAHPRPFLPYFLLRIKYFKNGCGKSPLPLLFSSASLHKKVRTPEGFSWVRFANSGSLPRLRPPRLFWFRLHPADALNAKKSRPPPNPTLALRSYGLNALRPASPVPLRHDEAVPARR